MKNSEIFQECCKHFDDIVAIRRDIHMHPETGFDVHRTAEIAKKEMEKLGFNVKTGVGKTGVVADLLVEGANRTIALRADMDALPMDELNDVPYKSKIPGKAHMCGHDAHTAILIGAARVIHHFQDRLRANVRFVFQPNEEQAPGGAPSMIEDGVLDGVDEIFGLHVWPMIEAKKYGLCVGPAFGQPDAFDIKVIGVGTHAAIPYAGKDPILAASQLVIALQSIIAKDVQSLDSAVVSVTQFHSGSAYNIIPQEAVIKGTVRTFSEETQQAIYKRMKEMIKGVEAMYGVQCEFDYTVGYPVTFNHEVSVEKAKNAILDVVEPKDFEFPSEKILGGEDFGYYVQKIPGCYAFLGCRNETKGIHHICHHPKFDIDEDCLPYGMALHATLALQY